METIIKDKSIKGDLICDGELIFAPGLGRVDIEGRINAQSIEIEEGTNIYSGRDISSRGDIYSRGHIFSDGCIFSGGQIYSGGYISSGGHIYSGGRIYSREYIFSGMQTFSGGDIYSGRYIYSRGDIYFSYHLIFKTEITCKLLRLSCNHEIERQYWIEKFNLFGFKKIAKQISTGCVTEIKPIFEDKKTAARLLKCKYFTKLEKLIIKSWHKGELEDENLY